MQILLLQDRADLREKIGFFIESTYSASVLEATSANEALKLVQSAQTPIDLIIVDSKAGTSAEFEQFWTETSAISTLLCAQGSPKGMRMPTSVVGVIERSSFMESVVSTIDELIEKGVLSAKKAEKAKVRIRTKLLLSVCPLKGDIYIRLSDSKYVKLFHEGDVFDLNDLEKYTIKKGVDYLYIRDEQCQEFALKYKSELEKLLKSEHLNIEDVSRLNEAVHETVQELTRRVGFTREVQEMTRTQVQLTVKAMGKDPDLAEILKKLKASEGQYISSHSSLCAYLACAIAGQLQWGSDTTFYKLSLASFLHDITLTNHDLARLNTLGELERDRAKFTPQEFKQYKDHPVEAAELAKKMTEVPPDVDTIIRQHHERPDGTGFPRGLGHSYIAPLASVFIVAHDLTQFTTDSADNFTVAAFLVAVRDKYKSSQFKKILACIETVSKIRELSIAMKKDS